MNNSTLRHQRQGRLLCSPRNPILEAQQWLKPFIDLEGQDPCRKAYILGLGAGYHVLQAAQQGLWQKIIVLEADQNTIDLFLQNESVPENVEIVLMDSNFNYTDQVMSAEDFDYLVMPFKPSWAFYEKEYFQLWLSLVGLKTRQTLKVSEKLNLTEVSNQLSELKEESFQLRSILLHQNGSSENYYLKILGELVN